MTKLINYSKVRIYFPLNDPISKDLINGLIDKISNVNQEIHTRLVEELEKLIETNKTDIEVMSEEEYTIEMYRLTLTAAYDAGIDVTPILYDTLLRHEIKNLTVPLIEKYLEGKKYTDIDVEKDLENICKIISDLKKDTLVHLAKEVTLYSDNLDYVRSIAQFVSDKLNLKKDVDYLPDDLATISTLSKFGGTLFQARELAKKYII